MVERRSSKEGMKKRRMDVKRRRNEYNKMGWRKEEGMKKRRRNGVKEGGMKK